MEFDEDDGRSRWPVNCLCAVAYCPNPFPSPGMEVVGKYVVRESAFEEFLLSAPWRNKRCESGRGYYLIIPE